MAKSSKKEVAAAPAVAAKKNADQKAVDKSKKEGKKVASAPVAAKEEKKSKKSKKLPTPPPESESESESEEDDDEDEDEEEDSSDDEEEETKPAAKTNGVNGAAADDDDSDSDEDEDSDEGTSDEDDDEEDSDEEEEAKPSAAQSKVKAAPKAAAEDDDDEEDSDESDSDEDDEEEDEEEEEDEVEDKTAMEVDEKPNGKRKAEENAAPSKKAKTDLGAPGGEEEPTLTVFVGQLSWNVDDDWLGSEFESCGAIESAKVMLDRDSGRSKGIGFVTFTDLDSSAKAVELNGKEIDGRTIKVNYAKPRQPREAAAKRANAYGDQSSPPNVTLYVGGLSYSMGEDEVYEAFGEFGDIQRVRIPTDRDTGAPKGYAYVEFADLDQSKAAFEGMQGKELGGRYIRVDYDRPKEERSNGFGGGRGGGRGGFNDRGRGRGGFGGDRGGRGGFGGRGGGRGGFGDRGGRGGRGFGGGRGRGAPRGGARTGGIVPAENQKISFD